MLRFILVAIFLLLYFLLGIPVLGILWLIGKVNKRKYAFYEDSKLQLFKIGTRTPPSCGDDVFSRYINSSSVLKVPAGCVDAYKKAKGWKGFTTISELDE